MKPSLAIILVAAGALGVLAAGKAAAAPSPFVEDFTGGTTTNNWYYFNGACLTASAAAGTGTAGGGGTLGTPGVIPGCTKVFTSYYSQTHNGYGGDASLVGGNNGTFPDPVGSGALRFTNGSPYGYGENGAIVSAGTFDASQGIQITFKTVTYLGDKGGAGGDGADGMSFYLLDATQTYDVPGNGIWNGIGAFGGSLAYTCSNANNPHDGLVSGYLGLGIDEYGNFLNGETLETGYTGATATGDNTALGYGYLPGRIGLRGAGSISWASLHNLNSTFYPGSLTAAQQQTMVQDTCETGTLWTAASPGTAASPHNTGTRDRRLRTHRRRVLDSAGEQSHCRRDGRDPGRRDTDRLQPEDNAGRAAVLQVQLQRRCLPAGDHQPEHLSLQRRAAPQPAVRVCRFHRRLHQHSRDPVLQGDADQRFGQLGGHRSTADRQGADHLAGVFFLLQPQ